MRECDPKDIVLALKQANPEVANLIFSNVSSRMAESIKSDLEITVNVRIRDVEEAQQRIVNIIRSLEEQGELVIVKGGKDDIIANLLKFSEQKNRIKQYEFNDELPEESVVLKKKKARKRQLSRAKKNRAMKHG